MIAKDVTTLALLNRWQRDFPLCDAPFQAIGDTLGLQVADVIRTYENLQHAGAFSRIGAVFAPGAGGASTLAAMAVPQHRLEQVAALVSIQPGVNHNYEREHRFNLWFVVTGHDAADIERQMRAIETATGIPVMRLPMLRAFRIDTAFDLTPGARSNAGTTRAASESIHPGHLPLAALAEQGLPLCERPFEAWARQLGCGTQELLFTLRGWLDAGILSRFGVVVRHHELGYSANAMTVFQVPAEQLETCGQALSHCPSITLVYQRAAVKEWPFNLYCMVHGRDRRAVEQTVADTIQRAGMAHLPRQILFSRTRFKQTGASRFARHLPGEIRTAPPVSAARLQTYFKNQKTVKEINHADT